MEYDIDYVKRRLKEVGRPLWPVIAGVVGVPRRFPEKLVYGERKNPGVMLIRPLLDYFRAVDSGRRKLPKTAVASTKAAPSKRAAAPQQTQRS